MKNKRKLLEIYAKTSTPEELFIDSLEKIADVETKVGKVSKDLQDALDFIHENSPLSKKQLVELILPLIPEPKHGKNGEDGYTQTEEDLMKLILPLIPVVHNGKDGSPDTPKEIRDKIRSLKGKERLSVFDLKDTEWLKGKGKETIQWSPANGGVNVSTGGSAPTIPKGTVNGINTVFTASSTPTIVFTEGGTFTNGFGVTISGMTITFSAGLAPQQWVYYL